MEGEIRNPLIPGESISIKRNLENLKFGGLNDFKGLILAGRKTVNPNR